MERKAHFNPLKNEDLSFIDFLVEQQENRVHKITTSAQVMDTFQFSDQQMRVFNSAFSYYLFSKESADVAYLYNRPETEYAARIPWLSWFANIIEQKHQRNELVKAKLKEEMELRVFLSYPDEHPTPLTIKNAANLISNWYLQSRNLEDFVEIFKEKATIINCKVFKR